MLCPLDRASSENRGNGHGKTAPTRLLPATLRLFESAGCNFIYPQGTFLFCEGQAAAGIFVLHSGRVKLSVSDSEGHDVLLRIAEPGEVLGLSATLSSHPHEVTAETITPCQVAFVWREDLFELLQDKREAALCVVQWLSDNLNAALEQIRSLRQQDIYESGEPPLLLHRRLV